MNCWSSVGNNHYQPNTRGFFREEVVKHIPDHLIYEILLRSTAESLIRFKSVSKGWYSLIKNRNFIIQHNNHHEKDNQSTGIVLLTASATHLPEVYNLSNLNKLWESEDVVSNLETQAEELQLTVTTEYLVRLTSCNGLVCIYTDLPLLMWNPVTREAIMLPKPLIEGGKEYATACGFGYDASNDEYKVVQLLHRMSDSSLECMVLKLGTNLSWRRIQYQYKFLHPNLGDAEDRPQSIFMEGSIYWWNFEEILCFDLTAETFKLIPAPEPILERCPRIQSRLQGAVTTHMVELDKNLCFVKLYVSGGFMDTWVLQKNCANMKTPWIRGYSIDLYCINNPEFIIKPICIRSEKIYLQYENGLACYDTQTKEFAPVFTKVANFYNDAVAYTKNTVCLRDIVGRKCASTAHIGECLACRELWHIVPKN